MNIDNMLKDIESLMRNENTDILILVKDGDDVRDYIDRIVIKSEYLNSSSYRADYSIGELHNYREFNGSRVWISSEDYFIRCHNCLPYNFNLAIYDSNKCIRPDSYAYCEIIETIDYYCIYKDNQTEHLLLEFLEQYSNES